MIDLVNVTKTYETGTHALNGIDMHIDDGEFVFLVGPSGSGKSTIIKLLTAELKPTSGSVLVNGYQLESIKRASIPYMRRTLGVIFQDFRLIENKTVYENVAFAMRVIGAAPKEIKKRVPYVLELVGLENKGRRLPNELSGGEQQRVAIARALINNPTMIIADEPTGNLDPQRSFEIMLLLEQINALGTTVAFSAGARPRVLPMTSLRPFSLISASGRMPTSVPITAAAPETRPMRLQKNRSSSTPIWCTRRRFSSSQSAVSSSVFPAARRRVAAITSIPSAPQ